jgi:hypothetical protein
VLAEDHQGRADWKLKAASGLLIPVRDAKGRIVALLVRRDESDGGPKYVYFSSKKWGGPGPGRPVHVPLFSGDRKTVRVTEGILKADIAAALSGTLTIGLPGVSAWSDAAEVLRSLGAETVLLAYDADASTKRHVATSLINLARSLHKAGFKIQLEVWNRDDGKGIDDLLAAGKKPELFAGKALIKQLKAIRKAAQEADPLPAGDGSLPSIVVNGRQPRDLVHEAWRVVLEANNPPRLFRQGTSLVALQTTKDMPFLHSLDETHVLSHLIEVADWLKASDEKEANAWPPPKLCSLIAGCPDSRLPEIESVIEFPVFGSNEKLVTEPGYHPDDLLWFHQPANLHFDPVPSEPTQDDVEAARKLLLEELLADFPFASEADRSHALAAFLLPFARRLIPGPTPLHLVEAPVAGSGKSILCKLISLVATGRPCEARTLPTNEDEIRKMITSELTTRRPIILLDNAAREVASASLASILTTTTWTDRLLGKSEMLTLANNALWLLTGNNPQMSMEIARRSVRIRIDPKRDQPWRREGFKHPQILEWTQDNRPALLRACLVLVQAWLHAGKPLHERKLGSFEKWSAVMGGILEVAGVPGFLENLQSLYDEADAEGQMWREFVAVWWKKYQDRSVRVSDLVELCGEELLQDVLGGGNAKSQATKLGKALGKVKDCVYSCYRISQQRDGRTKSNVYALIAQEGQSEPTMPASDPAGRGGLPTGHLRDISPAEKVPENKAFLQPAGLAGHFSQPPRKNQQGNQIATECTETRSSQPSDLRSAVGLPTTSRKSRNTPQIPENKELNRLDLSPERSGKGPAKVQQRPEKGSHNPVAGRKAKRESNGNELDW